MEKNTMQNEKKLVGNVRTRTNFFNQEECNLGFNAKDLELMVNSLDEKGWVNLAMRNSKKGGKYMYIVDKENVQP